MAYPETDVIVLCFSVVRPDSMENIITKWIPELNRFLPDALIILVGTQCDLRDNNNLNGQKSRHISTREGEELRHRIKARKYIECSAYTQHNVKEVFDTCIQAYIDSANVQITKCCFESLLKQFRESISRRFNLGRSVTNYTVNKHLHES